MNVNDGLMPKKVESKSTESSIDTKAEVNEKMLINLIKEGDLSAVKAIIDRYKNGVDVSPIQSNNAKTELESSVVQGPVIKF